MIQANLAHLHQTADFPRYAWDRGDSLPHDHITSSQPTKTYLPFEIHIKENLQST